MSDSSPQGMLFVAADCDVDDDADFNLWYDFEHVEERARIEGFVISSRYQAVSGGPRYLGLYRTRSLNVFTSASYKQAFAHQTPWSVTNLNRMKNAMRRVSAISCEVGLGVGAWISVLPLSGLTGLDAAAAKAGNALRRRPGVVRAYLLTPDESLSGPLPTEKLEGRRLDPIYVVECTEDETCRDLLKDVAEIFGADAAKASRYRLKWSLHSAEVGQ